MNDDRWFAWCLFAGFILTIIVLCLLLRYYPEFYL